MKSRVYIIILSRSFLELIGKKKNKKKQNKSGGHMRIKQKCQNSLSYDSRFFIPPQPTHLGAFGASGVPKGDTYMAVMIKIPMREPMLMFGSRKMLRKEKKL